MYRFICLCFVVVVVVVVVVFQLEGEENAHTLPNGVITSAEPRPNAYMPSADGELPVPKPYGSHAPFRPSLTVGNLRHYRKPLPQPIDI